MSNEKHYVLSSRTTREGLEALNDLKKRLGVGWDELVVKAVCGHYGLDEAALMPQRAGVSQTMFIS